MKVTDHFRPFYFTVKLHETETTAHSSTKSYSVVFNFQLPTQIKAYMNFSEKSMLLDFQTLFPLVAKTL